MLGISYFHIYWKTTKAEANPCNVYLKPRWFIVILNYSLEIAKSIVRANTNILYGSFAVLILWSKTSWTKQQKGPVKIGPVRQLFSLPQLNASCRESFSVAPDRRGKQAATNSGLVSSNTALVPGWFSSIENQPAFPVVLIKNRTEILSRWKWK